MSWRWVGSSFLKRLGLILTAGLVIILLLHVETGVRRIDLKGSEWGLEQGTLRSFDPELWQAGVAAYLQGLSRGDLGLIGPLGVPGFTRPQPVSQVIARLGPNSVVLLLLSLFFSLVLGTAAGLLASRFGARWLRLPALSASLLLISMPDVLVVMLLRSLMVLVMSTYGVRLFAFSALGGALSPGHFVVPVLALTAMPLAVVARLSAVAFDEVYDQLYIRTAMAKGLRPWRVVWVHALKNAWIRVAEAWPLILASLTTGLVVVEFILYFPGIGRTLGLTLEKGGDQAAAISSITLSLLAVAALLDLLFQGLRFALDPRLKESGQARRSPGPGVGGLLSALLDSIREMAHARAGLGGRLVWWSQELRHALWRYRPSRILRMIIANRLLLVGLLGVGTLLFLALFGAQFLDVADRKQLIRFVVRDGALLYPPYRPGTEGFPLGSDLAGRSVLTLLLTGARYTLFLTLAVTPLRLLVALPWGLSAGFRGRLWAAGGQSLGLVFSAMPLVLVPAVLLQAYDAVFRGATAADRFWFVTAVLAVVGIPRLAETIRQHVEAIAVQPFVEGARAVGAGSGRILWHHIFPHLTPQLWVAAAADMAWTLLLLAQFGVFSIYLGGKTFVTTGYEILTRSSGVWVPRVPDWSSMLSKPYDVLLRAPWAIWYPALAFLVAIISFNLVAEGLRRWSQRMTGAVAAEEEVFTPRARRRLALEWTAALMIGLIFLGSMVQYLRGGQQLEQLAAVQPTLEQAGLRLHALLQLGNSKGASVQRDLAVGLLRKQVEEYLLHASKTGYRARDMEEDTGGRLKGWDYGRYQVVVLTTVDEKQRTEAQLFVIDQWSMDVSYARPPVLPSSVSILPMTGGEHWLLLAGRATETDLAAVTLWAGPDTTFKYPKRSEWRPAPALLGDLARFLPELTVRGEAATARAQATDSGTRLEAAPDGDVTVCSGARACITLPWTGDGWQEPAGTN